MVRAADAHGVQPGGGGVRHHLFPLQNHGQRPRPELPGQGVCQGRHILAVPGQPLGARHMDDEGVVLGTALCLKDLMDRFLVQGVGSQAVNGFRGDGYQPSLPQNIRRCGDLIFNDLLLTLGIPQVKISCVHPFRLTYSIRVAPVLYASCPCLSLSA